MSIDYGMHLDVPAADYHAAKGVSASALRMIHNKTPGHLKASWEEPFEETWEMKLGTLIHHRLLEPGKPFPQLAIVPDSFVVPADYDGGKRGPKPGDVEPWNWRMGYCKKWKAEQKDAGKIIVTKADVDEIERAAEVVLAHPEARELLTGAATEVTCYWQDKTRLGPIDCKARIDILPRDQDVIADLKTCEDASNEAFQRKAWGMGYHLQAAWYQQAAFKCDGVRPKFAFIAYERGGFVKVHHVSREVIVAGAKAALVALDTYAACLKSGKWPGYSTAPAVWELPKWERNNL